MKFFDFYTKNTLYYDLLHKFSFKEIKCIPKFKKIVLSFCLKKYEIKYLLIVLSALKIISGVKFCNVTKSKSSNVSLKIKKGNPIGGKVILKKMRMNLFLLKLLSLGFLNKKNFENVSNNTFSFKIKDILKFSELEQNYQYFKNLPILNVNIIFTSTKKDLLLFLLRSYKLK